MTNIAYRGGIVEAKKFVLRYAGRIEHIVFLFDNIDKGWATNGVDEMDVRLVRLLLEALEKVKRDLAVDKCDFRFAVFLRNDVFELMVPGTRMDWTDRVKLKQVIQFRLQASLVERVQNFNELWTWIAGYSAGSHAYGSTRSISCSFSRLHLDLARCL